VTDGRHHNQENIMVKFFKRVIDAYIATTGNYPLPMVWTV
jgi:hypothetical protein